MRRVAELETPALLIDVDILERNLERVAAYARQHGLRLRPHTKTHKMPWLGRRQLDMGAVGLTVAKTSEAEVMLGAAPPDLLVAYPVVGQRKLERLMAVAQQTRVTVAVDSLDAAKPLSEAAGVAGVSVGVLAETDVGLRRVGVAPGPPLVALARELAHLPHLRFEGVAFYPGHIKKMDDEGHAAVAELSATVARMVEELRQAGLAPGIVSGGSTPALFESHRVEGMNEIRPGTYVFNDRNTVLSGGCERSDCAATILCTVVSTARGGHMILDGGSKTFSSDRVVTGGRESFGELVEAPHALFERLNEEHGYVDLMGGRAFRVGDRVRVLPNHVCVAMNLHETVYGVRGDEVVGAWRVEGRGKLQ